MQVTEAHKSSTANNLIQAKRQPFFNKEGQGSFFSKSNETVTPFFSPNTIQTKLTIGQPNDKYEVEADAMADKVVQRLSTNNESVSHIGYNGDTAIQTTCDSCEEEEKPQKKEEPLTKEINSVQLKSIFESSEQQPETNIQKKSISTPVVQAKCTSCEQEGEIQKKEEEELSESDMGVQTKSMDTLLDTSSNNFQSRLNSSKGGGSSLSPDTQTSMGSAFGADFSNVRVHTGSEAVQMSQGIGAQAFTYGSDIYFNQGKYDTNSSSGKHLLAHELTHTVQQSHGNAIAKSIQKSGENLEVDNSCTLNDTEKLETLQRLGSQRRLREIMARETRRERNENIGMRRRGLEQNLTADSISRANNAIFTEFGRYITDQNPARLNHPNTRLTRNSSNLTVHNQGTYARHTVSNDDDAIRSIVRAARKFISDDLFAACITSAHDPVLLRISHVLLQNAGRQFVLEYEETTFDGNTSFGSGPEGHVNMPSRASHIGHRYIHELMHYYVHENYRRTAEVRPLWKLTLMEGGAELMARHVIHNQLAGERSFTIRNIYGDFLADLINHVISRMSFEVFKLAYFSGRSDILESFLPNQESVNINPKLQEHSSAFFLQSHTSVPIIQKSGDSLLPITELSPIGNRRINENEFTTEAVTQASLNDCYLMAALASLAATPHGRRVLRECIVQESEFQYRVRFFRNSETSDERVAQWFTVQHQERENRRRVAPWVRVIEQAYAQLYQSDPMNEEAEYGEYAGMGGRKGGTDIGGAARAFSHLTGRNGNMLMVSDQGLDQLWERIDNAIESGRHIVAGTSRSLDDENAPAGIHHGHNYSILDAFERDGERIVSIRNPWGGDSDVANDHGTFEIPFSQLMENFLQIAISDFPNPNLEVQGNTPTSLHPKLENGADVSFTNTISSLQHINPQIQRQTEHQQAVRRDFGSFIFYQIPSTDGQEFNYYLLFNLNLFLERNSIEGVTSNQIQSLITESLNRHASGEMQINDKTVNVSWQTNWIGDAGRLGVLSGLGRVNLGQAIGIAVYPQEVFAGERINGLWEYDPDGGVHRIIINGDYAFTALNTRGRGRRARQQRENATNLFGNEITHELGHALGLSDGRDRSSVMNHSNARDFRRLHGEQIRQIAVNLTPDPNILPNWLQNE